MSGSLKYMQYQDNLGANWAFFGDESNIEGWLLDDASVDITIANVGSFTYKIPQNIKPRTATFKASTGQVRRCVVPTPALFNALLTNDNVLVSRTFTEADTSLTFTLIGLKGEEIRPITTDADTGINDGDAS